MTSSEQMHSVSDNYSSISASSSARSANIGVNVLVDKVSVNIISIINFKQQYRSKWREGERTHHKTTPTYSPTVLTVIDFVMHIRKHNVT